MFPSVVGKDQGKLWSSLLFERDIECPSAFPSLLPQVELDMVGGCGLFGSSDHHHCHCHREDQKEVTPLLATDEEQDTSDHDVDTEQQN